MRHIRRVLVIGLIAVFLIALVIGAGVIFSVRNVNVTYINYSSTSDGEYEQCKKKLKEIKGSSLLFLKESTIEEKIIYSQVITVESYEKVFPCTVNVVLKERVECFAVKAANGYSLYDEDGAFIKTSTGDSLPLNGIDGCPDVEIIDAKEKDIKSVAKLCACFKENFGSLRRQLESVTVQSFFGMENAEFKLRNGLIISVSEWRESGELKIKKAYDLYSGLTDSEKVNGTITVVSGENGASAKAIYSAN